MAVTWPVVKNLLETAITESQAANTHIRDDLWNRCIGVLSKAELERLRTTHIAVLGIGGIGMPLLELLVRAGAEKITIVDNDKIDPTNLNRVPLAFPFTVGQPKVEVAELFMRLINSHVQIRKFQTITSANIAEVLNGVEVVALTLDGLYSSLVTAKYCREQRIPFIEGWALAGIMNARIFDPSGPSYEETYGLKITKNYDELTENDLKQLDSDFLVAISKISQETTVHYTSEGIRLMLDGAPRRSFGPFVWIISAILASELVFKLVLNRPLPQKCAPDIFLYDYMRYLDLAKKGQRKQLRSQITAILNNGGTEKDKVDALLKMML
jgi:molybdopterin/thiamine biosynthesis adenylyltransferase